MESLTLEELVKKEGHFAGSRQNAWTAQYVLNMIETTEDASNA